MTSVSVTKDIHAPAERVWTLVTDLPRMGEWSPENTGGEWTKGSTGPAVGATFVGTNKSAKRDWSTQCTVRVCKPPRSFAFDVNAGRVKVATWSYEIEPTATGCRVTETWTDRRNPLIRSLGGFFSGVSDRESFNRTSMEHTLNGLAEAVGS